MRRFNLYLGMLLAMVLAWSCNDDFDTPPVVIPSAQHTPNTTIAQLKEKYWNDATNYIDTVKDDIVIHGRVVSSDASGNIYKSLVIQDETGAIAISINGNDLYTSYRIGQEIVIPMKGLWVGKYNGLQQIGYPQAYRDTYEASFLPLETFKDAAELNGLPEPNKVDTVTTTIKEISGTDAASLRKWKSQLVRFDNVKFTDADGKNTFSESSASTNRSIEDLDGNTIILRNSNYASFKNTPLPSGTGSVVGILSFYGSSWQVLIRSVEDCVGCDTINLGTRVNPCTVDSGVNLQNKTRGGWFTGYIVGAVAPEVTQVKSNSDIEWKAPTTLDNTLVIGPSATSRDISQCVIVSLPQGSVFRQQANLKSNAELLGTQIWVKGTFATYMGANGVTGNSGSAGEFKLSITTGGVKSLSEDFESAKIPDGWKILKVKGNKDWYVDEFSGNHFAKMSGYKGTAPFDSWLISPAVDIKNAEKKNLSFRTQVNSYGSTKTKLEVYLLSTDDPNTATLHKLNAKLATAPASGYSEWVESGDIDLSKYADGSYYIGFRYVGETDANYSTWEVDDVKFNANKSVTPPTPEIGTRADLETMNGGTATGIYGTYTAAAGWKAANCNVLQGGTADSNPVFKFIGFKTGSTSQYATAINLNGKTTAKGVLTSPAISGGIGTLTFNYGLAYTEQNGIAFHVAVMQGGKVVKEFDVEKKDAAKYTAYSHSEPINVKGVFTLVFTAKCQSNSTANKDRVAIWNINWTENK